MVGLGFLRIALGYVILLVFSGVYLFDLAIIEYPMLLIFAAILGWVGLFFIHFIICDLIAQCIFITAHIPTLSWSHLLFILVFYRNRFQYIYFGT